jgi:FK506-binding protein 4/5
VDGTLLNGDISLIDIRSVDDCSMDYGSKIVYKKTLKKGSTFDCPNEFSTCKAELSIREKSGRVIVAAGRIVEVVPGTGRHSEALESAIIRIVPDEEVEVTAVADDAWIDPTLKLENLKASETVMHLKLISFTKAEDSWSLTPESKLARLGQLKEAGGEIFKSGRIRFALTRYVSAARLYEHDKSVSDEAKSILKLIHLNEAMCYLKLNQFSKAEVSSSKVLKEDPENIKALYRRAQSLAKLGQFDRALADVKRGLEIEPNNSDLRSLYSSVRDEVKKSNEQMKGLYSKMMKL